MSEEINILDYLSKGGKLTAPDNAPPRYRAELLRMMASFVDSELAGAAGFADIINRGSGIKERIAASRIVLEKFDHGERVLNIMGDFGVDVARYQSVHPWSARINREDDLGSTRREGDMRLNVFHYPVIGWTDAVVMNVLMGRAVVIQLEEFSNCSYQPLAETFQQIAPREIRHTELGLEGLTKITENDGRAEIEQSIAYWRPRVGASFGGSESPRFAQLKNYGLRRTPNEALREQWEADIEGLLP